MQTQAIFKAGNSNVVTIPKHLLNEVGFKHGQKVIVEKSPNSNSIVISKVKNRNASTSKTSSQAEFKKWLDIFLEENSEILDELAVR